MIVVYDVNYHRFQSGEWVVVSDFDRWVEGFGDVGGDFACVGLRVLG